MFNCSSCGSKVKRGTFTDTYLGKNLGKFRGWICPNCGEKFFPSKEASRAEKIVKKLGLWGKKA